MTRLNKPADPVRPSVPDPVDAWLDVLVAMLSIPKPDRQRVRDELEDHLRSRIDDLLIHGLTEPQALQKAVAELGETADLARQLSHAHKPPRTRRYAMHALIIALAGTVVALGVNTVRPSAALPAAAVVATVEPDEASKESTPITLDVRDKTIGEMLESYRAQAERPVVIHWSELADIGLDKDSPVNIDSDPLPAETVFRMLGERTRGLDAIDALVTSDRIEIGVRSAFDRQTTVRRVYSLSEVGATESDMPSMRNGVPNDASDMSRAVSQHLESIGELLVRHVEPGAWVSQGGDLANYSVTGRTLVVTAPERIQQDIADLLSDLRDEAGDRAATRRAERDRLLGALREAYEEAFRAYSETGEHLDSVRRIRVELQGDMSMAADAKGRADIEAMMVDLESQSRPLEMRLEEFETRVRYLRSRMIDTEYEHLLQGLPTSHQPSVTLPSEMVRIEGMVARPGDYEIPSQGITVKRLIAASGGIKGTEGQVHISRGGVHYASASIRDVYGEGGEMELEPGDRVSVAPASVGSPG